MEGKHGKLSMVNLESSHFLEMKQDIMMWKLTQMDATTFYPIGYVEGTISQSLKFISLKVYYLNLMVGENIHRPLSGILRYSSYEICGFFLIVYCYASHNVVNSIQLLG